ncbi:CHAT domain-containing protein [Candidatus Cyanaurora vandensis]|uniref:CHAT domain-containing protein n=1 Tax=Candidatus Cyanaurora vandensis TaxID=2714958 RepID=UPI00257CB5E4|nr:CHAT domain-containing protein [Candidatus Cyanaurora vandensis]
MTVITLREQGLTDGSFTVTVQIGDGGEYAVVVSDPFTAEAAELRWYFEQWLVRPMLERVRAERAQLSIRRYGEALFRQVFVDNHEVYVAYREAASNSRPLRVEIVGRSLEFQALHWEAMWEPNAPSPLAVTGVMVRRSVRPVAPLARGEASPLVRLLVVVARPDEDEDVGYRTVSRPLIEAVDNGQLRVQVDLLRPGTFEALSRHLEVKEAGFYHVIHFDTHGALLTYEQLGQQESNAAPRARAYRERFGRSEVKSYVGVKAFLVLEGEQKGAADLVEATELAALLTGRGIPVCVLNACQSGMQVETEAYQETSLGSQLLAAGVQAVVAMS